MLYVNVYRGDDSTGVAAIMDDGSDAIVKGLGPPWEVIDKKEYRQNVMGRRKDVVCLIGHNRAATRGNVTLTNAHPFKHGNIVLVHNGTLFKDTALELDKRFHTDSEKICYAIDQKGIEWVWNRLDGGTALVWWDIGANTLNMIRNDARPLCFAWTKKGLIFASEGFLIRALCARHSVALIEVDKAEVRTPIANHVLSFSLDSLPDYYAQKLNPYTFSEPWKEAYKPTQKIFLLPKTDDKFNVREHKPAYNKYFEQYKSCCLCQDPIQNISREWNCGLAIDANKALCADCTEQVDKEGWLKWN
jgi:asparagine synthetase B (glutamine-hydrolysing)